MTDNEIIKALECCGFDEDMCLDCPVQCDCEKDTEAMIDRAKAILDLINRQKAENEQWKEEANKYQSLWCEAVNDIQTAKAEAIKELSEKITEIFMRYEHLHSYAEEARKDYIETVGGTEIEMQSVWDVITLQKNGMAEYEEMGRLQKNIEIIEKERLLTELEKDFRLLVKEMVGE